MTDPHGAPHGASAWNPGGAPPPGQDPEQTRLPGAGAPYGQQYPGYPEQGQYPGYGATAPHPGQPYPPSPYGQPTETAYGQPGYGQPAYGQPQFGGQYGQPGYPAGTDPYGPQGQPGGYGPPPRQGGNRIWILVAALVGILAVAGTVVAVILINRSSGGDTPGTAGGATVARGSSAPGAAIPDAPSTTGLTDTITLDGGDGRVGRLDVAIRFEHRYPDEISGVLTAPDGRTATVVPRGPETTVQLSSADPGSPLQSLVGAPITGAWRLTLTDAVSRDTGRLVSWDITADPDAGGAPPAAPTGTLTGSSAPGTPVPDDSEDGISDTIQLTGSGSVERIRVAVQMQHTAPADLLLQLRAPSGELVTLADHDGSTTFTYESSQPGSPLSALVGEPAAGAWELLVVDDIILDEGTLLSWELAVNG